MSLYNTYGEIMKEVLCDNKLCLTNNDGFCSLEVISIDSMGNCEHSRMAQVPEEEVMRQRRAYKDYIGIELEKVNDSLYEKILKSIRKLSDKNKNEDK